MNTRDPIPVDKWHEDDGDVLWWRFPVVEAPYVGTPLDDDFPDYVTHWTPLGPIPNPPPPPPEPCESCGGIHRSPEDWDLSNAECIERLLEQRDEAQEKLRYAMEVVEAAQRCTSTLGGPSTLTDLAYALADLHLYEEQCKAEENEAPFPTPARGLETP